MDKLLLENKDSYGYDEYIAVLRYAQGTKGIWSNKYLISAEKFENRYPELAKKYRTRHAVTTGKVLIELDEIKPF